MNHRKTKAAPVCRIVEVAAILCLGTLFIASPPARSQSPQANTTSSLWARWTGWVGDRSGVANSRNNNQRGHDQPNSSGSGTFYWRRFEHRETAVLGQAPLSVKPLREGSAITLERSARATVCARLKGRAKLPEAPCFPMRAAIWPRLCNKSVSGRKGYVSQSRAFANSPNHRSIQQYRSCAAAFPSRFLISPHGATTGRQKMLFAPPSCPRGMRERWSSWRVCGAYLQATATKEG